MTDPLDSKQRETATERMSPAEAATVVDAVRTIMPRWIESHVDERDACMAGDLRWLDDEGADVLAVMAKDHVPGVVERLDGRRGLDDSLIQQPAYADAARISESSRSP